MKLITAFQLLFSNKDLFMERLFYFIGSDCQYLKYWFKNRMGYFPNFEHPKTFNEKLQWLKLNYRKPILTTLVDKYAVKNYVAHIIGEEYIIPTLGLYNSFDEINFDKLPEKFVLKCTHDSGSLVICRDKNNFDIQNARLIIEKYLETNYYKIAREWPYKNIVPRIIAEQYLEDTKTDDLYDYKFFCFHGKVKCFKIDFDRFTNHKANYYSRDAELLPFGECLYMPDFNCVLNKPKNFERMIEIAEFLSKDIPFVRVDLYEVNGRIYFGEMTLFPAAGVGKFKPDGWDTILGNEIVLPK